MKTLQVLLAEKSKQFGTAPRRSFWGYTPLLAGLLVLFLVLQAVEAPAAPRKNTLFLPLKINAQTDAVTLAAKADQALGQALIANRSRQESFRLLPRAEAEKTFDYTGSWPPPVETLQNNIGPEISYVAAGSLTFLGKQISIDIKVFDLLDPTTPAFFYKAAQELAGLEPSLESLVGDIHAHTDKAFLIASIKAAGNERIDTGAILRRISTKAGEPYDADRLRADLKDIFKMGYFDDVKIRVTDTEMGKDIVFEVKEKPVIGQVTVTGNKELKDDAVMDVVTLTTSTIINPKKVREEADNILALYKSKGYYNTTVETQLSYPAPDRVDVRFIIDEGPKMYIKEVRFLGNSAFSNKELKKIIETSEKNFLSWLLDTGLLKKEVLEQDMSRLTAYYNHHGYIEAQVADPEISQEGDWLFVTFKISEGARYRVGKIEINGDLIDSREALLELIRIDNEEFLSRKILREDILRLNDFYAEHGYAFADASPAVDTRSADKIVDIDIRITQGDLAHINRIIIKGNTRTRDKVIRREMEVAEGGVFNSRALRRSNERLQRLDFFEDITVTPEPTLDRTKMDVVVEVKEKPTGAFSIGAGYSSVDNLIMVGEVSQNNLFGKGQRLALQANISGSASRYNISFTEPHLADSKLLFGFDLYNWKRQYDDFTKDSYGGAVRFGYPVWEEWKAGFSYGYDNTSLSDFDPLTASSEIIKSSEIEITSFVDFSLGRDTRNRMFDPTKGSLNQISAKYAGGFLGGDSQFTKVEGTSSWYFPGFLGTTYHVKVAAGQAFQNESDKLPVYERFFLGGIQNIRGFNTGDISPLDPTGNSTDRVGGEMMWYTNLEWLFPLSKQAGLKGLIFFDAGNVYYDEWNFDEIKSSVGAGFRWLSPMGLLRLEWGYNLDPVGDEEDSVWDFSIGGGF